MLARRAFSLLRYALASPAGSALAVRDFRMLWLSNAGGSFALNLWFLATAWLVFSLTESFEPQGSILGGGLAVVAGNSFAVLLGAGLGVGVVLVVFARSRALRAA